MEEGKERKWERKKEVDNRRSENMKQFGFLLVLLLLLLFRWCAAAAAAVVYLFFSVGKSRRNSTKSKERREAEWKGRREGEEKEKRRRREGEEKEKRRRREGEEKRERKRGRRRGPRGEKRGKTGENRGEERRRGGNRGGKQREEKKETRENPNIKNFSEAASSHFRTFYDLFQWQLPSNHFVMFLLFSSSFPPKISPRLNMNHWISMISACEPHLSK